MKSCAGQLGAEVLNSQLGERRQMSSSITPCLKFTSVTRSQRFRYGTSASTETPQMISEIHRPACKGLRSRLRVLLGVIALGLLDLLWARSILNLINQ
jgi:hypothetical protein